MESDFYSTEMLLTDEEREVRQRVREFCEVEVAPSANERWEKAEFPLEAVSKLADLGVVGGTIKGYGCPGIGEVAEGLVTAEMARVDGSFSGIFGIQSTLTMRAIAGLGSEKQKEQWLPKMARMERIGAFGITEPKHGSDIVSLEASARREGDEYVINGDKRWVGNASVADLAVIFARDEEGNVGGFIVEKGTSGFEPRVITGKISMRSSWQTNIVLNNVRVPVENRLEHSRTFEDASQVLSGVRPTIAWQALGLATGAYQAALTYAKKREQFGKPIAAFQLIQQQLSDMAADLSAMRLICLRVSRLLECGEMDYTTASMAKMDCARKARRICAKARDIVGGNGILREYEVARHFADMEAVYTYEGTDHIQSLLVGREITGISAFR